MIDIKRKEECSACLACYNACPVSAISFKEDKLGFKYPIVDKKKCIQCRVCKSVCPMFVSQDTINGFNQKAYAVINPDKEIRSKSSSGGVFSLIAEAIIKDNGVVFGAAFDNDFNVYHTYVDNIKNLDILRGSKYIQSNIGNSFVKVKEFLKAGRKVLFSGTPCQIAGLNSFLGKSYDNLYLQDLICHGVPSTTVWKKYLEYRKSKDEDIPTKIFFRDKEQGWRDYQVKFKYATKDVTINHKDDIFMKIFLNDLCLRDSCYDCKSKGLNKIADITLADFWGIKHVCEEMFDNKGTSLVIINSKKGEELFKLVNEFIMKREVDLNSAIEYNMSIMKSANKPDRRDSFIDDLQILSFKELIEKYISVNK